jgi:hypothetical protein
MTGKLPAHPAHFFWSSSRILQGADKQNLSRGAIAPEPCCAMRKKQNPIPSEAPRPTVAAMEGLGVPRPR